MRSRPPSGWCSAQAASCERARQVCAEVGEGVRFEAGDTSDPDVARRVGRFDGLFVDGREVRTGPPPSPRKLRRLVRHARGRSARHTAPRRVVNPLDRQGA